MKNDKIKVSVLLIAYNEERYIRKAIDSVLNQKVNFKYEILCHDDASTDSTALIISEYATKYPDVIVPILQEENQISKSDSNIVIKFIYPKVRGKYIAYIDADDYWIDKNKLQRQHDFLENHSEYNCIFHNFKFVREVDGSENVAHCGDYAKDIVMENVIPWNSWRIPQIGCAMFRFSSAYPRPELFVKIGGGKDSLRPISDMPLYIWLVLNGRVRYIPDVMSVWMRRISGTWGNDENESKIIAFKRDELKFYENLDLYTRNKYAYLIGKAKDGVMFSIYFASADYKNAKKYKDSVNVNLATEILIFIGNISPAIANWLRKFKKRIFQKRKLIVENRLIEKFKENVLG